MIHKKFFANSARCSVVILCVFVLILSSFFLSSCNNPSENSQKNAEHQKSDAVELEYFNANRYTATIVENDQYIFWADSRGINRREKSNKNETLLLEIEGADHLSLYGNHLYFVTDDRVLHRVNLTNIKDEILFDSKENEYYLCQTRDYCIANNKIFFLNTHSLFYFDLNSREVINLLDTSIYTLQMQGDTVYFLDAAESTFTLYAYSIENNTVEKVVGNGITSPQNNICSDFRIINGKIIYSLREPYETRVLNEDGSNDVIFNNELHFSVSGANGDCLYSILNINENEACLYSYSDGEQKMIATLSKMNIASGFTVIDGYVYYKSGYETKLSNMGNVIYDYSKSIPTVLKIES